MKLMVLNPAYEHKQAAPDLARGVLAQKQPRRHYLQRIIMKKILLIAIALLVQVPVHAQGLEYDKWCALGSDQRETYMAPLSLRQRLVLFYDKLGDFSKELTTFEAAARQSGFHRAPVGIPPNSWLPHLFQNTQLPEDVKGFDRKLKDFMESYAQFVLEPRGKQFRMLQEQLVPFLDFRETTDEDKAFHYSVALALHYRLRLHDAHGVQPWFVFGVHPWFTLIT